MRRRTLELSKLASRTINPSPRNSSKFVPNCCLPHGTSLIISVVQLAASKNFSMMCRKVPAETSSIPFQFFAALYHGGVDSVLAAPHRSMVEELQTEGGFSCSRLTGNDYCVSPS